MNGSHRCLQVGGIYANFVDSSYNNEQRGTIERRIK